MKNCFRFLLSVLLFVAGLNGIMAQEDPPNPSPHGVIDGTVLDDSTGLPIREARVKFFNIHRLWTEGTHTDSNGYYHASLDTGNYLVRVEKFGYIPEWFDNAREVRDGLVLDLHQDTTLTANVSLQPFEPPIFVNVTGTVTDSATGAPLQNALVAFVRPHRWLKWLEELSDWNGGPPEERVFLPGLGRLHGVVWFGLTDENGNYEAHVLKNLPFIAVAVKPGYLHEFYNNKLWPFDADKIVATGNLSGINFDLVQNPLAVNTLSGRIVDSSGSGVPSHVLLVRLLPNSAMRVRYVPTDSLGNYLFQHLVPGRFLVKAVPMNGFAPAWYAENECGIRNWHNADVVEVLSNVSNIDVCVRPYRRDGFCRISGNISEGGGNLFSAAGLGGVSVYAVSGITGEVEGYDITEDDGSYSIDNLTPGSYTVTIDKEGYVSGNSPVVTVDETNGYDAGNQDVGITSDPLLGVVNNQPEMPKAFQLYQNFPNPFNPVTVIRYDVPVASIVTLKVYNLIGQRVQTLADEVKQAGSYSVRWNGTDDNGKQMTSGIYFVKFIAKPVDGERPAYESLRKMIMVK